MYCKLTKSKNLALTILMSIIITGLIVGFVNIGINLFLDKPQYDDYCYPGEKPNPETGETSEVIDYRECGDSYDNLRSSYTRTVFFILSIIGLILILVGIFIPNLAIQIIGMSSGGVLAIQGIIQNRANQLEIFIALGILIVLAIYVTVKKLKVI